MHQRRKSKQSEFTTPSLSRPQPHFPFGVGGLVKAVCRMGHGHSSPEEAASDLAAEVAFLSEHTNLTREELLRLHAEYFSERGAIAKKDFVREFRALFPHTVDPDAIARRTFAASDTDGDGKISFAEFVTTLYLVTAAPKELKLRKLFRALDEDRSGCLSCGEVMAAVKRAYDILDSLNFSPDFNAVGVDVFRSMDLDGDLRVTEAEFVARCLQDAQLSRLLEATLGKEYFTEKARDAHVDSQKSKKEKESQHES